MKQNNVKKGDELDVVTEEQKLVISSHNKPTFTIAELNYDEYGRVGSRMIGALFKAGCDEIKILYKKPETLQEIERVMRELIGFEIINQTHNSITLREVSVATYDEFQNILSRTFLLVSSVIDDCYHSIQKHDFKNLKNVIQRDITINKYANFCRRILNKKGYVDFKKTPMIYCIVEYTESLGDVYKDLATYIIENKIKIENKEYLELLRLTNNWVKTFFRLFSGFSKDRIREYTDERAEIKKRLAKIMAESTDIEDIKLFVYLSRIVARTTDMLGPLLTSHGTELGHQSEKRFS